MTTLESTKERLKDHEVDIQVEDGYNRIIRFHKDNKIEDSIYITTWKNRLCFSGDLGTFVFNHSGVEDMLRFFRGDINPDYWRESLRAGVALQFDRDSAMAMLRGWVMDWYGDLDEEHLAKFDQADLDDLVDSVEGGLWDVENEHQFFEYAYNYSAWLWMIDTQFDFSDWYEDLGYGYNVHTKQYEFACYALHILSWRLHDCSKP